ncbi:hypothetical protein QZH41_009181 [Actinostola sp. cb2023]|nr:hypothetical protein QZH41_009181 [Actinostola sp. cb2023]
MNVGIVKLHEHQELIDDAVRILNNEWPRSENARMHSLTDSRDDLPCCLLLVAKDDHGGLVNSKCVIGHSKLTRVHGKPKSVFLENVVVDKVKRGCGFGRKLMELSEHYVFKQGYEHIHLSTHDKCKFYEHLGYRYSSPVSPVRANAKLLTPEQVISCIRMDTNCLSIYLFFSSSKHPHPHPHLHPTPPHPTP